MKRISFQCKLLTDLVLSSRAATEGFQASLDYIPGSKFLGLVARELYDMQNSQQTLDFFHNGCVRFGDAHPITSTAERTFRVPLSWNGLKGKGLNEGIYLQQEFSDVMKDKLVEKGIQLKQIRGRYVSPGGIAIKGRQNFSIKSAYDRTTLSSKDGQMYGYFALQRGTLWGFDVDLDNPAYEALLKGVLVGKHRIGRSKAAEYGLVEIKEVLSQIPASETIPAGEIFLYALSNWCFYDDHLRCTLQPKPKQLGLPPDSRINWAKSQLRTRTYRTWNQKRSNRDADRQIIEKGSVLAVEISQAINTEDFQTGIGAHRSEGFGQVLINPELLSPAKINEHTRFTEEFHQVRERHFNEVKTGAKDHLVIKFLQDKADSIQEQADVNQLVNDFIAKYHSKYKGITASQWGQVRNIAKNVANRKILQQLLFSKSENQKGYFYQGQSEDSWRKDARRATLQLHLFGHDSIVPKESTIDFLVKMSTEMAKSLKQ